MADCLSVLSVCPVLSSSESFSLCVSETMCMCVFVCLSVCMFISGPFCVCSESLSLSVFSVCLFIVCAIIPDSCFVVTMMLPCSSPHAYYSNSFLILNFEFLDQSEVF